MNQCYSFPPIKAILSRLKNADTFHTGFIMLVELYILFSLQGVVPRLQDKCCVLSFMFFRALLLNVAMPD